MENEDPSSEDEIPSPAAKRPKPQPQNPTFNLSAAISQAVMKGRPKNGGPPSSLLRGIGAYASEVGQEEETQAEDNNDDGEEQDIPRPPASRKQKQPTTSTTRRRKCRPCATYKKSCPGGHPCSRCVKRSTPEACIEYIPKQTRKQVASDSSPRPSKRIKPISTPNSPPQTSSNGDTTNVSVEPSASSTPVTTSKPPTPVNRLSNGPRCKACIARKKG